MDMEMMLPGRPTVPTLIYAKRKEYVEALQGADQSIIDQSNGEPDLKLLSNLMQDVVTKQLASAIESLAMPRLSLKNGG